MPQPMLSGTYLPMAASGYEIEQVEGLPWYESLHTTVTKLD